MYICEQCDKCLFYNHDRDFGDSCDYFTQEGNIYPQTLRWVSYSDMQKDPNLIVAYHRSCQAFTSLKEVRINKKVEITKVLDELKDNKLIS